MPSEQSKLDADLQALESEARRRLEDQFAAAEKQARVSHELLSQQYVLSSSIRKTEDSNASSGRQHSGAQVDAPGFSWSVAFLTVCQVLSILGCVGSVLGMFQLLGQGWLLGLLFGLIAFPYNAGMFLVFSHVKEARRAAH